MERIWEFKTAKFVVTCEVEPEMDSDLSWADAETLDNIARGVYGNYCFAAKVYRVCDAGFEHEIAADYLGNSVYADPTEFVREHIGLAAQRRADGIHYGCYFLDMVREAISAARKN